METTECYAIKDATRKGESVYVPGFRTRAEAENALRESLKERGHIYTVVYVRIFPNQFMDENGNFTRPSIAEIPEPGRS